LENQGYTWELETLPEVIAYFSETQDPNGTPWITVPAYTYKANYNPVEYAYRTAAMARSERPYVIIVDDIKKDTSTHDYQWLMPVESDLTVESSGSDYLVLIGPDTSPQGPRLWVQVLDIAGTAVAPALVEYTVETSSEVLTYENFGTGKKVVIETNAVEPSFMVLLMPYYPGEALPTISWDSQTELSFNWPISSDNWTVIKTGNRTSLALSID
jgi:hypothetical protein